MRDNPDTPRSPEELKKTATGYRVNEKSDDGAVRPQVEGSPAKSVEACQLSAPPAGEDLQSATKRIGYCIDLAERWESRADEMLSASLTLREWKAVFDRLSAPTLPDPPSEIEGILRQRLTTILGNVDSLKSMLDFWLNEIRNNATVVVPEPSPKYVVCYCGAMCEPNQPCPNGHPVPVASEPPEPPEEQKA